MRWRESRLPVYGRGENVRDWLFVDDHAAALILVLREGAVGETYNVGGRAERRNIDVVTGICDVLDEIAPRAAGSHRELITFVTDRPGHDLRYAIDCSKIERDLGWRAQETFESGLRKTVQWYIDNPDWWGAIRSGKYRGERLGQINVARVAPTIETVEAMIVEDTALDGGENHYAEKIRRRARIFFRNLYAIEMGRSRPALSLRAGQSFSFRRQGRDPRPALSNRPFRAGQARARPARTNIGRRRRSSPFIETFGKHVAVELSFDNWRQLLVPIGFAHGFCTLEPNTEVFYKVTNFYSPQNDRGLAFDDPDLGIDWPFPASEIQANARDRSWPRLRDLVDAFE